VPESYLTYLTPAIYALALIIAGIVVRHIRKLEPIARPSFRILNVAALWVMLPTIVFVSIARYRWVDILKFGNVVILALASLGACFGLAVLLSTIMRYDRKTTIAVALNSGFMNVTYLGIPLVYAIMAGMGGPRPASYYLGPASLYAVAIGVPHLALGVMYALAARKRRLNARVILENVLVFPATIALITALLFVGFNAYLPSVIQDTFDVYLAKPFFALMLLLVGYQMPIVNPRKYASKLVSVGAMRFLVSPLVTYALIMLLGLTITGVGADLPTNLSTKPALIQSIMPPAVFNIFLAYNFKLDLKLYGAIVFYLTLVSLFVALPIMIFLIS
jgi:predicted permease